MLHLKPDIAITKQESLPLCTAISYYQLDSNPDTKMVLCNALVGYITADAEIAFKHEPFSMVLLSNYMQALRQAIDWMVNPQDLLTMADQMKIIHDVCKKLLTLFHYINPSHMQWMFDFAANARLSEQETANLQGRFLVLLSEQFLTKTIGQKRDYILDQEKEIIVPAMKAACAELYMAGLNNINEDEELKQLISAELEVRLKHLSCNLFSPKHSNNKNVRNQHYLNGSSSAFEAINAYMNDSCSFLKKKYTFLKLLMGDIAGYEQILQEKNPQYDLVAVERKINILRWICKTAALTTSAAAIERMKQDTIIYKSCKKAPFSLNIFAESPRRRRPANTTLEQAAEKTSSYTR